MGAPPPTSVAIVGGGIGGMAAALSLLQAGFDVHVYERAAAISEVGAGIQVSPNASRVLHRLGLAEDLARMGVRPEAWHQRRWDDGRTLLRADLGDAVIEAVARAATAATQGVAFEREGAVAHRAREKAGDRGNAVRPAHGLRGDCVCLRHYSTLPSATTILP